ncbi:UNVERIFIED_CONTAM: TITAN-like protein [Sesamum calycinum]|uniref:TITAN-like protein n=1 Tax=Sesamum calycinum TaxID=2727403 RepID=A0AAW2PNX3_9LAMI
MNQKKKKKNSNEQQQFEYCEVCRVNHNQGRRHNYFPNHKTSLATLLTRFQSKLSDVKFFVKTPMLLHPEHAHQNRLCGNAIEHLASVEHWKSVKGFMWKYGGGMDRVDLFLETKCKSLNTEAAKVKSVGPVFEPLNNIRNGLNADYVNSFQENNVNVLNFPLQMVLCLYIAIRMRELRIADGLANPVFLYAYQITWKIVLAPILLLVNVHSMVILLVDLFGQNLTANFFYISRRALVEMFTLGKFIKFCERQKRVGGALGQRESENFDIGGIWRSGKEDMLITILMLNSIWLILGRVWQSGTRKESRKGIPEGEDKATPQGVIMHQEMVGMAITQYSAKRIEVIYQYLETPMPFKQNSASCGMSHEAFDICGLIFVISVKVNDRF